MPEVIEIAEVMEDTVLAVHHLAPARRKSYTAPLWAAAALGLAVFFAAGGTAVSVAAENRAALRAFVDGGGAPIDFRARRLSPFVGLAAVSGLLSGLSFAVWACWRRAAQRRASSYRAPDGTTIVEQRDGVWRFTPAAGMTGEPTPIERGAKLRAALGPVSFHISAVASPRASDGVAMRVDRRALGYAAASAAGHGLLVAFFFLVPATARGYSADDLGITRREPTILRMPQEDPRREKEPPGKGGQGGEQLAAQNAREKGAAGALGAKESTRENGRGKIKKVQEEPSFRPPDLVERARHGGALGVIEAHPEDLTVVTASGTITSGLDDENVRGGWMGDSFHDQHGWGSAPYGRGPGGGGHEPGTIGAGPYRTPYTALRLPPGTLPGRRPKPTFEIGPPDVPEGVDKNMIRRYVRQHRDAITYCYQRELAVRPALQGTATTAFSIAADGRVLKVSARGLGVPAVERCLEDVIRGIEFPRGQIINVTAYPFTFHPVGS